jgi:branched-chain amino acid transport system substrate-binding protein
VRKLLLLLLLALGVVSGVVLTGCGKGGDSGGKTGSGGDQASGGTIKIGLAGVRQGGDGQIGVSMMNGSQIAIDEWNAKGGVLGKQIEPDVIDDGGSGQQAVSAAQSLIDAGVAAVIGHFNSSCTLPASRLYNDAKLLEISPGSTNPQYTEQGFPYAFRICGRDDQQGTVIANYLHDQLKVTKIAILDDKTTYGEGIAKIVKDAFEAKGGQVVMFQGVDAGDFDFRANISVAQGAGAQALMWGGMYKGGGPLCVQMREAGFNVPFISDDGCMDQKFADTVGADAKDVYVTFGKDYTHSPAAQAFIAAYEKKYNEHVGSYSIYGYDAAQVIFTAMQKAGSTDTDKVAAVLKSQPFDTIQGQVEFDSKGDLKAADYIIWTVKDGKLQEMAPAP